MVAWVAWTVYISNVDGIESDILLFYADEEESFLLS